MGQFAAGMGASGFSKLTNFLEEHHKLKADVLGVETADAGHRFYVLLEIG